MVVNLQEGRSAGDSILPLRSETMADIVNFNVLTYEGKLCWLHAEKVMTSEMVYPSSVQHSIHLVYILY